MQVERCAEFCERFQQMTKPERWYFGDRPLCSQAGQRVGTLGSQDLPDIRGEGSLVGLSPQAHGVWRGPWTVSDRTELSCWTHGCVWGVEGGLARGDPARGCQDCREQQHGPGPLGMLLGSLRSKKRKNVSMGNLVLVLQILLILLII